MMHIRRLTAFANRVRLQPAVPRFVIGASWLSCRMTGNGEPIDGGRVSAAGSAMQ
jgi:hypothetical protein